MAKDLNRSIKIYIDNSDAMKKASDLEGKMASLQKKMIDLDTQGKKGTDEYKKADRELRKLTVSYDKHQAAIRDTERVLKNLSGATRGELLVLQKELRKSLSDVAQGTAEYTAKTKALIAVEQQLAVVKKDMNGTLGTNATLWSRTADGFNKYFGIVTSALAGITGLSFAFRKLTDDAAEMDDMYTDVMKTTGMTKQEITELNEELKKIDTRTSREDLNAIAEAGGRIGIAEEDILQFAQAMNIANVALGDSFGSAEEIATVLGKLKFLFAETKDMQVEKAYLSIGSAINELGANGVASEINIANFATRVGSLPAALKPSIAQTLALGAAFEESGIEAEISARGYNIFVKEASVNAAGFAKVMGITTKQVEDLINTNPLEFFLQFSQGMKSLSATDTSKVLDNLKINADGVNKIIGAAANNADRFRELIDLSNKSFEEGTSVVNEYTIKNNNLKAELEKGRKAFNDSAEDLGKRLNPAMMVSTRTITYMVKLLPPMLDLLSKYGKYTLLLAGYYLAWNGRKVVNNLLLKEGIGLQLKDWAIKAKNEVVLQALILKEALYGATVGKTTFATKAAAIAQTLWNKAIMTNPVGILIGVLTTLIGLIWIAANRTKELTAYQEAQIAIQKKVSDEYTSQESHIRVLIQTLNNEKLALWQRKEALNELKKIVPGYHADLTAEGKIINDNTEAIKNYLVQLKMQIRLKAAEDELTELVKKKRLQEKDYADKQQKAENLKNAPDRSSGFASPAANMYQQSNLPKQMQEIADDSKKILTDIDKAILDIEGEVQKGMEGIAKVTKGDKVLEQRRLFNTMNKIELDKWIADTKNATSQYMALAKDVYKENFGSTYNIPGGDKKEKGEKGKLAEAKKAFDQMLQNLETKHQDRLSALKEQYMAGTIKSESEYNAKLFAEDQSYYLLREHTLADYIANTKDKELIAAVDADKKLAETKNKRLDSELKFRQKLQKIILDANPEASEQLAYDNRLQDLGLFGESREKLSLKLAATETESEKQALQEKLDAFILLEEQHQEKLRQIRNDAKAKLKDKAEEDFEKDFANRREKLRDELADEEQKVSFGVGTGALAGSDAFEADAALQQKRIALIQQEVDARRKAGLDVSKLMQKQRSEELSLTQLYVGEYKRRTQQYNQYGQALGSALGDVLTGQQDVLQGFSNIILDILFETLSGIINAKIAEATAVAIAEQAKAAAISAAQPDSVVTFGATAIARTAAIGAIIMGALSAAKSVLKGMLTKRGDSSSGGNQSPAFSGQITTNQRAAGKYDVIGAADGKSYPQVPYVGEAQTGVVLQPTLVGERGSELVVSHPDFMALQKHINYPLVIQAIQDVRAGKVQQRADGKYDSVAPVANEPIATDNTQKELLELLRDLKKNGLTAKAFIGTTELQAKMEAQRVENERFTNPSK